MLLETYCTMTIQGMEFTSGGAVLAPCVDGRYRGVVYVKPEQSECGRDRDTSPCYGVVTTWHGETIARAFFGRIYNTPFCCMRSVNFTYEGRVYVGRYCPDTSQMVRVRAL